MENITILLPAMASSTVFIADMPVLGEGDARLEKKEPIDLLYIPVNIVQLRKPARGLLIYNARDLGSAILSPSNDYSGSANLEGIRKDCTPEAC